MWESRRQPIIWVGGGATKKRETPSCRFCGFKASVGFLAFGAGRACFKEARLLLGRLKGQKHKFDTCQTLRR